MATKTRVTLEEFLAYPPTEPESELMDGEVEQKAMVGKKHSRVVARLIQQLLNYADDAGHIDVDTELRHVRRQAEWVFLPDVSVTLKERLAGRDPDDNSPVEVMPDFAIEVLSPEDRPGRVTRKIAHYMQAGVRLLWVIDPESEQVTVFRPGESPTTAERDTALSAEPVLAGFSVDLGRLFDGRQ